MAVALKIGSESHGLDELVALALEWATPYSELDFGELSVALTSDEYFGIFYQGNLIEEGDLEHLSPFDQVEKIAGRINYWRQELAPARLH